MKRGNIMGAMAASVPWGDDSETIAHQLAGLGYPGFAYLRRDPCDGPASVLLAALSPADAERHDLTMRLWREAIVAG